MKDGKRVILHVTFDGILFDTLSASFNRLDEYTNRYIILRSYINDGIKYISDPGQLIIAESLYELKECLRHPDIDIVFFHGIWPEFYDCYDSIRDEVITIWYCYGKELYEIVPGYPVLLRQRLFRPYTFWSYYKDYIKRFHFIRSIIGRVLPCYDLLRGNTNRRKLISRMDYIQTPLKIEYEMLKQHSFFRAKPFRMEGKGIIPDKEKLVFHKEAGGILINHSAAYTNNHLDVLRVLSHLHIKERTLLFPIVYGYKKVKEIVKEYKGLDGNKSVFIEDRLPLEEYEALMGSCTHAIYGTLRQQALGNIFNCFRTGVKVFLYKKSMNYRQFIKDGFYVYAIEEMSLSDLSTPLSKEEAIHNNTLFYALYAAPQNYLQMQLDALYERTND